MAYLLDTWAWMEYLQGHGSPRLCDIVEQAEVATSIVTVAELSDRYARDKRRGLDERIAFIASRGRILDLTLGIAKEAGSTKWEQRRRRHSMGLGDALIYETARSNRLTLLTGDPGFKGLPGVEIVD